MINDDLLVDIGPDIITSSFENKISLANICYCLQTHPHEDHFDPEIIISRHRDYGTKVAADLLIAGSRVTLSMMDEIIARRCTYGSIFDLKVQVAFRIKIKIVMPYKAYKIGDYQVIGYPANHHPVKGSLLYSIERDNNSVLYCTDTSFFLKDVWDHLIQAKKQYDLIILDHTYGIGFESKPGDHLSTREFIKHVDRFLTNKLLKTGGRIYATHLSHEGIMEHGKLDTYVK